MIYNINEKLNVDIRVCKMCDGQFPIYVSGSAGGAVVVGRGTLQKEKMFDFKSLDLSLAIPIKRLKILETAYFQLLLNVCAAAVQTFEFLFCLAEEGRGRRKGGKGGRAYSLLRALGKEEKETANSILAFTALQIEQSRIGNMKILNLQLCKFTNRAEIDLKSCINFQMCCYFFIIF